MGFLSSLPFAWGLMWLIRLIRILQLLGLLYEFLIGHYLVLHRDMNTVLRHLHRWGRWYGGTWSSKGVLQGLSARFLVPAFTWMGPTFWDNKNWKSCAAFVRYSEGNPGGGLITKCLIVEQWQVQVWRFLPQSVTLMVWGKFKMPLIHIW